MEPRAALRGHVPCRARGLGRRPTGPSVRGWCLLAVVTASSLSPPRGWRPGRVMTLAPRSLRRGGGRGGAPSPRPLTQQARPPCLASSPCQVLPCVASVGGGGHSGCLGASDAERFILTPHVKVEVAHSSDSLRPRAPWPPGSSVWDSPGQNTGVGGQALLQGVFLTQGWNPGLLHCRRILYRRSHQGRPLMPSSLKCQLRISACGLCDLELFLEMFTGQSSLSVTSALREPRHLPSSLSSRSLGSPGAPVG